MPWLAKFSFDYSSIPPTRFVYMSALRDLQIAFTRSADFSNLQLMFDDAISGVWVSIRLHIWRTDEFVTSIRLFSGVRMVFSSRRKTAPNSTLLGRQFESVLKSSSQSFAS